MDRKNQFANNIAEEIKESLSTLKGLKKTEIKYSD